MEDHKKKNNERHEMTTATLEDPDSYPEMNQARTDTNDGLQNDDYSDIKATLKATKKCMIIMNFLLVLLVLLTLAAIALAAFNIRSRINTSSVAQQVINCGPGLWHRVAYLNMSNPLQQCPSAWREYNTRVVRACGRSITNVGSCPSTSYSLDIQYSRVCGRVIGYQYGSPDAFRHYAGNNILVDGIEITYGIFDRHIWSYVAGVTEANNSIQSKCPCNTSTVNATRPPSFIGDNYYCESANTNFNWQRLFYSLDKLWDGQLCEGTCCSDKSPPWFSVQLFTKTDDTIKVSICCDEGTSNEDIPLKLLEIYVQ